MKISAKELLKTLVLIRGLLVHLSHGDKQEYGIWSVSSFLRLPKSPVILTFSVKAGVAITDHWQFQETV